jgi:hypothetical protein
MGRQLLDEHTADRLLSGVLAPEDAPPGYAGVAALLQAAYRPPTSQELARCSQTVAAMVGTISSTATIPFVQTRRRAGLSRLLRPRIAATLMAGALALFSGLAAAGALPGPLQHAAHVMFDAIGISVPDSSSGSTQSPLHSGPVNASLGPAGGTAPPVTGHDGGDKGAGSGGDGTHVKPVKDPPAGGKPAGHHDPSNGGTGDKPAGSGGSEGSSADQSGLGPKGLCNASKHGKGEKKGRAFQRLQAAAAARGETVDEYCDQIEGNGQSGTDGDHKKHHEHHGNSGHHRGGHGGDKHGGKAADEGEARSHEWSPLRPASPVDEAS